MSSLLNHLSPDLTQNQVSQATLYQIQFEFQKLNQIVLDLQYRLDQKDQQNSDLLDKLDQANQINLDLRDRQDKILHDTEKILKVDKKLRLALNKNLELLNQNHTTSGSTSGSENPEENASNSKIKPKFEIKTETSSTPKIKQEHIEPFSSSPDVGIPNKCHKNSQSRADNKLKQTKKANKKVKHQGQYLNSKALKQDVNFLNLLDLQPRKKNKVNKLEKAAHRDVNVKDSEKVHHNSKKSENFDSYVPINYSNFDTPIDRKNLKAEARNSGRKVRCH